MKRGDQVRSPDVVEIHHASHPQGLQVPYPVGESRAPLS
jgi:hypothetical protein